MTGGPARVAPARCLLVAWTACATAWVAPASGMDASLDADRDDLDDVLEQTLGADPNDPRSTPESLAVPETCWDWVDNDLDGLSDLDDPGCALPGPGTGTSWPAGTDVGPARLSFSEYLYDGGDWGKCTVDFEGTGSLVVQRGAETPGSGGAGEIPAAISAMQITGTAKVARDSEACLIPLDGIWIDGTHLVVDREVASLGTFTEVEPDRFDVDLALQFRSDISFDVLAGSPPGGPAGDPVALTGLADPNAAAGEVCLGFGSAADSLCITPPPPHYLCYKGRFESHFERREVDILDELEPRGLVHTVLRPHWYCNPVLTSPLDRDPPSLQCYKLKRRPIRGRVAVRNAYGDGVVETRRSELVCLPSVPEAAALPLWADDLACHRIARAAPFASREIALRDAWGIVETQLKRPVQICNPLHDDAAEALRDYRHLQCFKIAPRRVRRSATFADAFGAGEFESRRAVALCVRSAAGAREPPWDDTLSVQLGNRGSAALCIRIQGPPEAWVDVAVTGPNEFTRSISLHLNEHGVARDRLDGSFWGVYRVAAMDGSQLAAREIYILSGSTPCP